MGVFSPRPDRIVYTREALVAKQAEVEAAIPGADYRTQWDLRNLLDGITHVLSLPTPTEQDRQCEHQVEDGKSYWGDIQYRQCKSRARNRFWGWLNGPREEYLCKRHADIYLAPISMPLWIDGVTTLRYPACKWGHTWVTYSTNKSLDQRDIFNLGDVFAEDYTCCKQCGEPKVTKVTVAA